jgi:hypothetical protein
MTKEADLREVCTVARNPGIPFSSPSELKSVRLGHHILPLKDGDVMETMRLREAILFHGR